MISPFRALSNGLINTFYATRVGVDLGADYSVFNASAARHPARIIVDLVACLRATGGVSVARYHETLQRTATGAPGATAGGGELPTHLLSPPLPCAAAAVE